MGKNVVDLTPPNGSGVLLFMEQSMPDKTITCVECGAEFTFSEQEQEFYKQRDFQEPKRCKACRDRRKRERKGSRWE